MDLHQEGKATLLACRSLFRKQDRAGRVAEQLERAVSLGTPEKSVKSANLVVEDNC